MRRLLVLTLVLALTFAGMARPAGAQLSAQAVREAVDRGVGYLKQEQLPGGGWREWYSEPCGLSALCTLAMLSSGVPLEDDSIQRALGYLRNFSPERTYSVALQTMAFCRADPKSQRYRSLIQRNVKWLQDTQTASGPTRGSWSYTGGSGDNSNSQFALLALHEAERVGVDIRPQTWRLAKAYWERCQNDDGSWGYKSGEGRVAIRMAGTGSMTCAGITSLAIAADMLREADAKVQGENILSCQREQGNNDRVDRALQWLGRSFSVSHNPGNAQWRLYYLYGLERVGRLTARRFIGEHDWYREGADALLTLKGGPLTNHWEGPGFERDKLLATSFAVLFLSKGRWPILLSKLKHGAREEDWNAHRNDVANLTRFTELRWNRDLVWQIMDVEKASVDDLTQSPVLYYCGINSPLPEGAEARKELAQKLRDYLERGGFLLAEGYCGGAAFDEGFRKLVELMFPEPEYRLKLLPPEHPIWRAEEDVPAEHLRPLLGIEFGCRTSVVYSPANTPDKVRPSLSCVWELARTGRDRKYPASVQAQVDAGLITGLNILAYATNRELRDKPLVAPLPAGAAGGDTIGRGKLRIASLRHPGGCTAAPRALVNLLQTAGSELKIRVDAESTEINITDPTLFDYHLVFVHGRNAFRLTDAERKQLRTYLERGGMVFANAICASKSFVESFRGEMKAILPDEPLRPIPAGDPLLSTALGGYDLSTVSRRDPQQRTGKQGPRAVVRKVPPELEGIKLADRYGVIFSPYDLSCALEKQDTMECQGYVRDDAARIGLNVVLYSLQQ
jgi:hypothetical protein